jgi:hypothetical protein
LVSSRVSCKLESVCQLQHHRVVVDVDINRKCNSLSCSRSVRPVPLIGRLGAQAPAFVDGHSLSQTAVTPCVGACCVNGRHFTATGANRTLTLKSEKRATHSHKHRKHGSWRWRTRRWARSWRPWRCWPWAGQSNRHARSRWRWWRRWWTRRWRGPRTPGAASCCPATEVHRSHPTGGSEM